MSSPSPPIRHLAPPAPPLASATAAMVARSACGGVMMRGSFCDALAEVWRAVKSDGEVRRCLQKGSTDTTSALVGVEMACHAHPTWHEDCGGNPPGQSDVLVDCRLYLGNEYSDRDHDMMAYLRGVAAAVAACDPTLRASPIRSIRERDKGTHFLRSESGAPLQQVVAVCSELGDLPPREEEGRAEVVPAHYNIKIQVYGVVLDAGSPRSH